MKALLKAVIKEFIIVSGIGLAIIALCVVVDFLT
jgi:hypothetical protein